MRQSADLLTQYALYHRDQRNIATHFVGIPLIILGVGFLLARPSMAVGGWDWTPGWVLYAAAAAWYLRRGGWVLGGASCLGVGALALLAHQMSRGQASAAAITWGLTLFGLGWVVQSVGHLYEGKKPAFMDGLGSLLVGPMFLTAETLFARGWNPALSAEIERRAGPTFLRDMAV